MTAKTPSATRPQTWSNFDFYLFYFKGVMAFKEQATLPLGRAQKHIPTGAQPQKISATHLLHSW